MKEVLNSTAENSNVRRSFLKDCFHQGRRSTAGRKSGIGNLGKKKDKNYLVNFYNSDETCYM